MAESANRKGNLLISKHRRGDEGIYGLSPGLVRFLNEFVIAKLYRGRAVVQRKLNGDYSATW